MNEQKDNNKPVSRIFRLTPDLNRQLSDFKRQTGVSQSHLVRVGIELALEKYRPLIQTAEAAR